MLAFSRLRPLLVIAALLLFAGCKQEVGEPCEIDTDCATSICCCGGRLPSFRGVCIAEGETCGVCPTGDDDEDAGPPPDGAVEDAGPIDGGPDAGSTDAGPTDGGPTDAGADAGAVDAGTDAGADAGSDAGTDAG